MDRCTYGDENCIDEEIVEDKQRWRDLAINVLRI